MTIRSMTAFAAATALFAVAGCDKPPPPTAVEKPAGASTSGITDPAAMRALVQSERGGPAPAANSQLPADHPPIGGAPAGGAAAAAPAGGGADALPPGHPPIDGGAAAAPAVQPGAAGALPPDHPPLGGVPADLKFDTPAGWTAQPPTMGMGRKAQYVIPKVEGDPEDGEAVVFFFGSTQGGNVALNLDRWRGMFSGPDGVPLPAEAAKTETFDAGQMKVTLLDVIGHYTPASMGRPQPGGPKENYRMLAAVIETPGGNWFVRATGPNATMEKNRAAMIEFLKSAKM